MNFGSETFLNGSTWVRADFHMHTKADKEFKYNNGGHGQFAIDYTNALQTAGIKIGVITNHNKFQLEEFKTLRKEGRKKDIFLLPGIELSIKDGANGIHTLVVFSDDWYKNPESTNYIQSFLDVTFSGKANYDNENARSNHDLHETIRQLDEYKKDYFLIFAHVEAKSGLWHELDGGRLRELVEFKPFRDRCLGFQKVKTRDIRDKIKSHLNGFYPAEVQGCDCKNIEEIGRGKKSFIKVSAFTYEAVKLALNDYKNRVSQKPHEHTHSYIRSISFECDKLAQKTIHFSPEMNTLIGIRGSGKSSIIESLRYALDITFGKNSTDCEYKRSSVKNILGSGGKITIKAVNQHGQEYEITRILNEKPDISIDGIQQSGVNIAESVIKKPIYFGQKDLSNTSEGFETDIVEKLVSNKLVDIRQDIATQRNKIRGLFQNISNIKNVESLIDSTEERIQNISHQLEVFKKHNLEEKLKKQLEFSEDENKAKEIKKFVTNYTNALNTFLSGFEDDFQKHSAYSSKHNNDYFEELYSDYGQIYESFKSIEENAVHVTSIAKSLTEKVDNFETIKNDFKDEFAGILRDIASELHADGAGSINPDEFLQLTEELKDLSTKLEELKSDRVRKDAFEAELKEEIERLNSLFGNEFNLIHDHLEKINEQDTPIQIEMFYKGDKTHFFNQARTLLSGSGLREARIQKLVDTYEDPWAIYQNMEAVKKSLDKNAYKFETHFLRELTNWLVWQVPNKFVIKYHNKPLQNHSIGQRASALIIFILSQEESDVVIIDQPEDDLDNQTIYEEVIKLIHDLKGRTQFIFATHNANVPVLGDAEQILAFANNDSLIQMKCGGIDCPNIQNEIINVMEGGKEAFRRRKTIYGIWRPNIS